jgi:hypothetical protein
MESEFYIEKISQIISLFSGNINIPVIKIVEDYNVVKNLNRLFRIHGYFFIIVSTTYLNNVEKFEYLPIGINANKFLEFIQNKYNCDLIILFNNDKDCNLNVNNEVSIRFNEKLLYLKDSNCNESIYVYSRSLIFSNYTIYKVYKMILKIIS